MSAVDDNIMIEFQAFSVISAVVPTTTGKTTAEGTTSRSTADDTYVAVSVALLFLL